jgi:hypothetical protein
VIVEPDFLDHWKTRELVRLTENKCAPQMLMRLWAHCQYRKTSQFFDLSDNALALICQYDGDPKKWRETLVQIGFLEDNGKCMVVHDWDKTNAKMVSCWYNGTKGGRPEKKTKKKKTQSQLGSVISEPILSYLSYLSSSSLSEEVRRRFLEWIPVRKAMGKAPKDWDTMFAEQVKWLSQFNKDDQLEMISQSIRNNWQGLFTRRDGKQKKLAFENQI